MASLAEREYEMKVKRVIAAEFNMISGSHDKESMEASKVGSKLKLPNPKGKKSGVCTAAFLQALYKDNQDIGDISWVELLKTMRTSLKEMEYEQEPQLTSSRLVQVDKKLTIVPKDCKGNKRAVLIGINYVGQDGELSACHSDLKNVKQYLENVHGFKERDMLILMDDGKHAKPTKANILKAFQKINEYSIPGDVVFMSYSGHGGRVQDEDDDEEDGYDEVLIPVDYKEAGHIMEDDILQNLVLPLSPGVQYTVLMDCCHRGTVIDLPFVLGADDKKMRIEKGFSIESKGLESFEEFSSQRKDKCSIM